MFYYFALALLLCASLEAAPKLRLVTAAVGPISVTQGANAASQTVEAYNAGDGNLNLSAASSVAWVSATIGGARPCNLREGNCLPVQFQFQTGGLAAGVHTGTVTLSDAGALDAPQNITVTVQVGGGVPSEVNLYVAPNGATDEARFSTNSVLVPNVNTQSGGPWLSLALEGSGSFRFVFPYRIVGRHQEGMAEGSYSGTVALSNSQVAAENRTVQVRMQVTSQPIARSAAAEVSFRIAAGAPALERPLTLFNGGMGTLTLSDATAASASGGSWLSVQRNGNAVTMKADPAGLGAGSYAGTVSIASNAANSPLRIPVRLDVVAAGPPFAAFGGVLNSASFDEGLAPGGVAAVFGEQLSSQAPGAAPAIPLATQLNGVRVLVNDQAAPLYYTSYNQVNFQIPLNTPVGEATIRVERDGTAGNALAVQIAERAPRIIQIGNNGIVVNARDGSMVNFGGKPAKAGDVLTIYLVGMGVTDPVVATGSPAPAAEPLARVAPEPKVILGSPFMGTIVLDPLFAGLTPSLVGLYQINVELPGDVPVGDIFLGVEGEGYRSNNIMIPIRE
ncbi:MAG: hypothetical protein JNK48_15175 [Bryobacterales bacterium]|nr:hypothetical protein [Bryobacterales bacterium]